MLHRSLFITEFFALTPGDPRYYLNQYSVNTSEHDSYYCFLGYGYCVACLVDEYQYFRGIYCLLFRANILLSSILFIPLNKFTQAKRMSSSTELQEAIFYFFNIIILCVCVCVGETSLSEVAKSIKLKWNSVLKRKVVVLKT